MQESCSYAAVQACPELPSGEVEVNTLGIRDGQQQISLKLTDAAGNTTVVQGPTVVVDNNGPPAPSQPDRGRGEHDLECDQPRLV